MTKEIKNGCESIRKFMGVNDTIPHDHLGIYPYNSSWDWLIPVCEKIKEIYYVDENENLSIIYSRILKALQNYEIENVYNNCVKFIEKLEDINKPIMSFEDFKEDLIYDIIPTRNTLRVGQAIMNYLVKVNPKLYDKVVEQGNIDCFYVDTRIPLTLSYLKENWNK